MGVERFASVNAAYETVREVWLGSYIWDVFNLTEEIT